MKGKLVIVVILAAVVVALYFIFRSNSSGGSIVGAHPNTPFATGNNGATGTANTALNFAASLSRIFGSLIPSGGSATPIGGALTTSAPGFDTPSQVAAYDYALSQINAANTSGAIPLTESPVSSTLFQPSYETPISNLAPLDLSSDGGSFDYSAVTDSYGNIIS